MASPDVLLGVGLYETVLVSEGAALHGERHFERMDEQPDDRGRSVFGSDHHPLLGRVDLHPEESRP